MTERRPALSVLDLVPVRTDQVTADALAATLALARTADELGYRRYWLAEHHNMPAVAATNPPVLIGLVAGATTGIRVGSGGVMLPNHAPLVVAEQFALLEAAFPGRIDLGIGRAPGSDPVTIYALRHGAGGVSDEAVTRFPEYVENVLAMMSPEGVGLNVSGRTYPLRATPAGADRARDLAARLLGLLGAAGRGEGHAVRVRPPLLRQRNRRGAGAVPPELPSVGRARRAPDLPDRQRGRAPRPRTRRRGSRCPSCRRCSRCAPGRSCAAQRLVEEAEKVELPPPHLELMQQMAERWVIGAPDRARARIEELAATYDVDEVMVHPVAGAFTGTEPGASPARETTLRLLAGTRD